MNTMIKNIQVPTGNILIVNGDYGKLECLSIGDYGKSANIKADFLGLTNEINGVNTDEIMPLTEKWVITISTQYGCSMGCTFCDVPKVGSGKNASHDDMNMQIIECLRLHPEIKATKRLNLHYARMGEPTFNRAVLENARTIRKTAFPYIGCSMVHPVVSTMMPRKNRLLVEFIQEWCEIKNNVYKGDAGLQLSINSTSDKERDKMFAGNSLSLYKIARIADILPCPVGRKYALNFAIYGQEVDGIKLSAYFDPKKFMCKITPMHETVACKEKCLITADGYNNYYPYRDVENSLKNAGYDVIVFIPSRDEDESRITCGNAILSDRENICDFLNNVNENKPNNL